MNRNEAVSYIEDTYSVEAEYPFKQYPDTVVFRHSDNKKWFAVIINVAKRKLGIDGEGNIDILNLKCDPILVGSLRMETGFFPAYHMNKESWISAALDGNAQDEKIRWLLDTSFDLTAKKIKKR